MNQKDYQICTNCIMDTTAPNIQFDEKGWCDYCINYHHTILPNWHPNEQGERSWHRLLKESKKKAGIKVMTA